MAPLLALKVCLTSDQKAASIVFDEIDRGVGGATADAVGRRLLKLAESNAQVLAVTHSLKSLHLRITLHGFRKQIMKVLCLM